MTLESESDSLTFVFFGTTVNAFSLGGSVVISNKIYSLSSSENENEVVPFNRTKIFDLEDEYIFSQNRLNKLEAKIYHYSIQSHSIKTLAQS